MARERDYGGLGSLIDESLKDGVKLETTCPSHGEPLQINSAGVKNCPFGDYREGISIPTPPLGYRGRD